LRLILAKLGAERRNDVDLLLDFLSRLESREEAAEKVCLSYIAEE
jgi:hypothetical protein